MATSSGNSSRIHSSGSEEDLLDLRKRKRKESNRESARKSRMRKQKHLDDLTDQINQMKKENAEILTRINIMTPQLVNVEAENSVIRAQISELSQRLDYLNEITSLMNNNCTTAHCMSGTGSGIFEFDDHNDLMINNSWNLMYFNNQQPIMAAAEMLQY